MNWGFNFIIAHTGIWFNLFVLLALIALAAVIIYFIVRRRKLVKIEKELEDLLEEKYEREGINTDTIDSVSSESATSEDSSGLPEYK